MSKKNVKNEKNKKAQKAAPSKKSIFDDLDDLDDEKRVKSLSPTMLVLKRFIRNKLAIVGICILLFMVLFSFLGGLVYPHGEIEVFYKNDKIDKEYAGITYNTDYRINTVDGSNFGSAAKSQLILAISKNKESFDVDGNTYTLNKLGEALYEIYGIENYVKATVIKGIVAYDSKSDKVTDEMLEAFEEAIYYEEDTFEVDDVTYYISHSGRKYSFGANAKLGYATRNGYKYADGFEGSYDFNFAAELAAAKNKNSFTVGGKKYDIETGDRISKISADGSIVAVMSTFMVQPISSDVVVDIDHMLVLKDAVDNGQPSVDYGVGDDLTTYKITRKDQSYIVRTEKSTQVIDIYASPSWTHPLGTDANGMDLLARLMYGGRISLLIGFIVIILETVIGVILGGIAGFFGKWVDNLIMRLVDIFNCIPTLPIYLILGSIMDTLKIDPKVRIYYLMLVLGVLGWTGVARIVRGQILSLREQEFMIAAEATGLSTKRRIFKHLVPNVIPQLIVICTMGLGDVILSEATLSFLNLGVKHPYASWGNIINSVNDVFVMTNYWFAWIPAGMLILLTVLGFNFVGDGLRDAFDPKMKR